MAQVLVRGLPEDVVARLKERARLHGRSLEAELRVVLEEAAQPSRGVLRATADRISAETAGRYATETVELLREDRER